MAAAAPATSSVQAARPSVYLAGQEDQTLEQGMTMVSIRENVQGLFRCEARFGNWGPKDGAIGFLYFDRKKLDFGKQLQIKIDQDVIMDGRISGIESDFSEGKPPEITVLLEDRFQDLRMTRRTRVFENVSDADVVRKIASDYGLQTDIDMSGPAYKVLSQVNQSDLAFIRERARSIDAELWMDGSKLSAKSRSKRNGATLTLNYGGDLREFCVLADVATQRTSLAVTGWDVSGKTGIKHEAPASVIQSELNSGDTNGADTLKQAFAERKESVCHLLPLTTQDAQSQAEAAYKAVARRFLTGRGVAQINAKIRVGAYLNLQQLGPLFSGKYYVSEVHQKFDSASGFRSEFTVERPGIGKAS
jgi:phage protein D